jgi:hypothetical protein
LPGLLLVKKIEVCIAGNGDAPEVCDATVPVLLLKLEQ